MTLLFEGQLYAQPTVSYSKGQKQNKNVFCTLQPLFFQFQYILEKLTNTGITLKKATHTDDGSALHSRDPSHSNLDPVQQVCSPLLTFGEFEFDFDISHQKFRKVQSKYSEAQT